MTEDVHNPFFMIHSPYLSSGFASTEDTPYKVKSPCLRKLRKAKDKLPVALASVGRGQEVKHRSKLASSGPSF